MSGCPLRYSSMFMLDWCWNTFVKALIVHVWSRAFLTIIIFLLWIATKMRVILCCIVVSHRLNTKEALPKFSKKLKLNHIGESLSSRGGKLRKPKMKTLFWCHRNDAPNPCRLGCPFQSQNLGILSLKLIRMHGKSFHDSGMAWITTSGDR